ncbi:MAG: RluA family pseudouridine synthase [bacterium]
MKKILEVKKEESGQRLDKFIAANWPGYSRAYVQKQIKKGAVLVYPVRNLSKESKITQTEPQVKSLRKLQSKIKHGWISNGVSGQTKKPSYILKEADKIEVGILPPQEISLEPDKNIKVHIIYEDKDVIALHKQAGLTVHPSPAQKSGTLVNALLVHYPPLKDVGEDPARPGIVHRLDKDTSGLMIIAKNNSAFAWLKKQFQERKVVKKYLALVVGRPKKLSGEIKTLIARSKSDPTKQRVGVKEGKEAITMYKTLKQYNNFTLIEAQPKTGRMHQIRVHLAWLGNPVAGDTKYGTKSSPKPQGLKRQFLHATYLKIKLPNDEIKEFTASLPDDLQAVLADLK